jgi:hypothetical protein
MDHNLLFKSFFTEYLYSLLKILIEINKPFYSNNNKL